MVDSTPSGNTIPNNEPASGCWAFVLNPLVIEADLPFELAEGCFIDKATKEQTQIIKNSLARKIGQDVMWKPEYFYECEVIVESHETGTSTRYEPLQEAKWRYYVVTTKDKGTTNHILHLVSNISETALDLSSLLFYPTFGHGWHEERLHSHFEREPKPAKKIGKVELHDLAEVYSSYVGMVGENLESETYPEISRALNMYDSLSLLRKNSDFHVLGLFAIIEMLITHNPKLEDRGDSITHQMQSKIPLLSRRFEKPLDYSTFFAEKPDKKIWSALYAYRSAVAHGGVPDFHSNPLQNLVDANNANEFLREVVRKLLRQALKEPQLFRDLRDC